MSLDWDWCKYHFTYEIFCVLYNFSTFTVFYYMVIDSLLASAQAFRLPPLNPWEKNDIYSIFQSNNININSINYLLHGLLFITWIIRLFIWRKVLYCWYLSLHFAYIFILKSVTAYIFFTHYKSLILIIQHVFLTCHSQKKKSDPVAC